MVKVRLGVNNGEVSAIFYDNFQGKIFDVEEDFEENFLNGESYIIRNDRVFLKGGDKLDYHQYLNDTRHIADIVTNLKILNKSIPDEYIQIIEERQKIYELIYNDD